MKSSGTANTNSPQRGDSDLYYFLTLCFLHFCTTSSIPVVTKRFSERQLVSPSDGSCWWVFNLEMKKLRFKDIVYLAEAAQLWHV